MTNQRGTSPPGKIRKEMSQQVFVSKPTVIGPGFESAYASFERYLRCLTIEPITLGPKNYTLDALYIVSAFGTVGGGRGMETMWVVVLA